MEGVQQEVRGFIADEVGFWMFQIAKQNSQFMKAGVCGLTSRFRN
jgi:hypothetical protein